MWQEAPRGVNAPKKPAAEPEKVYINWAAAIWLIAVHIGALAAPWTFSWSALVIVAVLHWMNGSLGICLGFHRLLTHTGLETPNWVRNILVVCGNMAGEGGPLTWCANHRKHHAFSDQEGTHIRRTMVHGGRTCSGWRSTPTVAIARLFFASGYPT